MSRKFEEFLEGDEKKGYDTYKLNKQKSFKSNLKKIDFIKVCKAQMKNIPGKEAKKEDQDVPISKYLA